MISFWYCEYTSLKEKTRRENKIIKKKYGEDFAQLCRRLFPTILEKEGLLLDLITSNFAESRNLHHDIVEEHYEKGFRGFVLSLVETEEQKKEKFENIERPEVLLERAGYNFYKCETVEDVLRFKKYYAPDEELCTFREAEDRIKERHMFFVVKKNIDEIKRENFPISLNFNHCLLK